VLSMDLSVHKSDVQQTYFQNANEFPLIFLYRLFLKNVLIKFC
jgi:hypothetical protein